MTQINAVNLPKGINLSSGDLIECILKRKGGTKVDFGYSGRKKIEYHFQPLDSSDPESPHVCNVSNDDHYERFMNIPEGYRAFDPDEEYEPVVSLADPSSDNNFNSKNDFNDLLSVNPDEVTNDWLKKFSEEILGIKSNQKQELYTVATTQYGLEFDYSSTTATDMIRKILVERIKEEKNADNLS